MLVIGLTGGIASGKSAAAARFQQLGVTIIDADKIGHELVMPGKPALQEVIDYFGNEYLQADGTLNRAALGKTIFAEQASRLALENILHPLIRHAIQAQIDKLDDCYCIVVIPLLAETDQSDLVDRVLIIDVAEDIQKARLKTRDQVDNTGIQNILRAQVTREERLKIAHDVIINDASLADLDAAVDRQHEEYLRLCKNSQ